MGCQTTTDTSALRRRPRARRLASATLAGEQVVGATATSRQLGLAWFLSMARPQWRRSLTVTTTLTTRPRAMTLLARMASLTL
jgi:hypothetical protein